VKIRISVQHEDFDPTALQSELTAGRAEIGAVASFVGLVRSRPEEPVEGLELEHYPGMTERSIAEIVDQAADRWEVLSALVVHRVGALAPGDQIVYVGVASGHRRHAFEACEFIMDFLKTRAPFWKKETTSAGSRWVDARASDEAARARWLQADAATSRGGD
jgi:molybdopterin synthase catalytic subunit